MSNIGILAFDMFNQEGKNELYLSASPDFIQTLRLRIRNASAQHQIRLAKGSAGHFSLVLKKGLLPAEFKPEQISVTTWRQIAGADVFDKTKISAINAFNIENLKSSLKFDVSKIVNRLDELNMAGRGIDSKVMESGFDSLIKALKSIDSDDFKQKNTWINDLEEIKNLYSSSLNNLHSLTLPTGILANNPLLAEGFDKTATVFNDLAVLHERTRTVIAEFENFAANLQRQKNQAITETYAELKTQFVEYIKTIVEQNMSAEQLLSDALADVKISDIIRLDGIHLNDTILKKLEDKLVVEESDKRKKWHIEIATHSETEVRLQFTFTDGTEIVLNPNGYVLIDCVLKGALEGKAESINVELHYPDATFYNGREKVAISDPMSLARVNLVNYGATGLPAPVRISVEKGENILNNGDYFNEIILQVINIDKEPILFNEYSTVTVEFDIQQEGELKSYALTDKSNASLIRVYWVDDTQPKTGIRPLQRLPDTITATFTLKIGKYSIMPNNAIELKLANVVTGAQEGLAPVRIKLKDLPFYKDTEVERNIRKVTFLNENNEGIYHVGDNKETLEIRNKDTRITGGDYSLQMSNAEGFKVMRGNEVLLAIRQEDMLYQILPVGTIMMWYGDEQKVPKGWRICNGKQGTPDMSGRMAIGVGERDGFTYRKGDTGGTSLVDLDIENLPQHDHDVYVKDDVKAMSPDAYTREKDSGIGASHTLYDSGDDYSYYPLRSQLTTQIVGQDIPHENRPPFLALYYIMRVNG